MPTMEFCIDNGYDHVEEKDGKLVVEGYNLMMCHSCNTKYEIRLIVSTDK